MQTAIVTQDYHSAYPMRRGVYWSAIIGGAIAATTITLMLLALGAGLGFASVSPWYNTGASAKTITLMAIIWLVIMQWVSSGLGGYITGRLRNRWHGFHADEGFFRDTVHGFLTWAIATLVVAAIISSAASQSMHAGAFMSGPMSAHEFSADCGAGPFAYYIDKLYRTNRMPDNASVADTNGETARILMRNVTDGTVPEQDKSYLTRLVVARTGITPDEARERVTDVLIQEKATLDEARKATERFALFTFVAMLIGAFVASAMAAVGGMHRDTYDVLLEKNGM